MQKVIKELSGRVERISLFGSYPHHEPDLFTDLDILIIMRTKKSFLERLEEIYPLLSLPVDCDILCYTPEEFQILEKRGFFREISRGEVVLYEARSSRGRKEVA
ncbi:MAG: nucleotidyltransferase domain-containing protein [candidate division NC10 bacterium]|nr:nucleotidyltransferase domain-containing protein [candidate division NC10 bacterium]